MISIAFLIVAGIVLSKAAKGNMAVEFPTGLLIVTALADVAIVGMLVYSFSGR